MAQWSWKISNDSNDIFLLWLRNQAYSEGKFYMKMLEPKMKGPVSHANINSREALILQYTNNSQTLPYVSSNFQINANCTRAPALHEKKNNNK